jgi:transcriptional regulator with XRE-family HTH domain
MLLASCVEDIDKLLQKSYNGYQQERRDTMKLQDVRKSAGLSQAKLATLSGISLRTIQDYECGHRTIDTAKLSIITALADALQVPLYELMEDAELAEKVKKNLKRGV